MTYSTSRSAYEDCFDIFDRALASPKGIRVDGKGRGPAHHLAGRLQYARILSRAESREVNEPSAPGYGVSPYDSLIVRMPREEDGRWWVYIEPRAVEGEIQELGAAE